MHYFNQKLNKASNQPKQEEQNKICQCHYHGVRHFPFVTCCQDCNPPIYSEQKEEEQEWEKRFELLISPLGYVDPWRVKNFIRSELAKARQDENNRVIEILEKKGFPKQGNWNRLLIQLKI